MSSGTTPVYGIKYPLPGDPIRNTRQTLQDNATTIEAALIRGGVAAPNASDLATLAGRVTTLETGAAPGAWTTLTLTGTAAGDVAGAPPQYRVEGHRVFCRGWIHFTAATASGVALLGVVLPAAVRPQALTTVFGSWEVTTQPHCRMTVGTDGQLRMDSMTAASASYANLATASWGLA